MPICLSHQSALRYWLTKTGEECMPQCSEKRSLAWASANMGEIKAARLPFDYSRKSPLHVLVSDRDQRHTLTKVVTHVWSADLPKGSLYELSGENLVCSPELTFVQMASCRDLIEVVEIGCYLCGKFSISDEGRGYVDERQVLTLPENLSKCVAALSRVHGLERAREALLYVVPNTASPMEVLLVMAFVLPPSAGGWMMPEIVANQRIDVDEHLRPLVGKSYFLGDIYLPSVKGNIEFDSYEFHTGKYRYDHTQARRNVLEAMGVKTISATWGQLNTFEKFESFIWMVKERFGIEHHTFTDDGRAAQIDLYEHLTNTKARLF